MTSFASLKGPSITVALPPFESLTRAPLEVGCRPVRSSNTPALAISSMYFPISAISSSLGRTPASESLLPLTIIMNRILVSPSGFDFGTRPEPVRTHKAELYYYVELRTGSSTSEKIYRAGFVPPHFSHPISELGSGRGFPVLASGRQLLSYEHYQATDEPAYQRCQRSSQ